MGFLRGVANTYVPCPLPIAEKPRRFQKNKRTRNKSQHCLPFPFIRHIPVATFGRGLEDQNSGTSQLHISVHFFVTPLVFSFVVGASLGSRGRAVLSFDVRPREFNDDRVEDDEF
jgi:hypothetical protein